MLKVEKGCSKGNGWSDTGHATGLNADYRMLKTCYMRLAEIPAITPLQINVLTTDWWGPGTHKYQIAAGGSQRLQQFLRIQRC